MTFNPTAVVSVGGLVVDDDRLLLVRHTYPPSTGKYMLPGGVVDRGEMMDAAAVREVVEETGVAAEPVGIVGPATIVHEGVAHAYVFWLMQPVSGTPRADGLETDHCCYISFEEIATRDDVSYLVRYAASRLRDGRFNVATRADDFTDYIAGLTPDTYRIWMQTLTFPSMPSIPLLANKAPSVMLCQNGCSLYVR
ncbi:MAG TPA: NUDIX domain-containing protein [Thermomicrobiales bacterium]|nr:NUDIX domain-containing protein [Thermomicrobiales bacterium]